MSLNVLGLQFGHDGSATVVKDKKVSAHITSERITRFKKQRGVTKEVIDYVLEKSHLTLDDISVVAITNWFWDRDKNGIELFNKSKHGFSITKEEGVELTPQDYYNIMNSGNVANGMYNFHIGTKTLPCLIVDHHFAHASYSFYTSPYDQAFSFTLDVNDNLGTNHSVFYFSKDGSYRILRKDGTFGVGGFYSVICDYLGFYPSLTDAGKVMALSSYNKPNKELMKDVCWPNNVQMGDIFHGDQIKHFLSLQGIERFPDQFGFFPQLRGEGGKPDPYWLNKKDWMENKNKQIACDTQWILEESVKNFLNKLDKTQTITQNLCVAGGTFLNCVMNGKLQHETNWNIWASPACGDDGLSIGSALFLSHKLKTQNKQIVGVNAKFTKSKISHRENFEGGKRYSRKYIFDQLQKHGYKPEKPDDLSVVVAKHISENKIVAWFQDGSEIGPRALGNRSILSNPTNKDMKDILNDKVKHRESFRPFAPMILLEDVEEWFDIPKGKPKESPFMLFSYKCKYPEKVPSGVHIDGTSRIQTVDKTNNEKIYKVIKEFKELTGVPMIINTSFNVMGEPIVETPTDAIECFNTTKIDVLVIDNFIVEKS